jgi:hypothetical protein
MNHLRIKLHQILLLVTMAFTLTGCEALADIFRAGFWVGLVIAVVVIGIILLVIRAFK